ncbi:Phospholipid:diacylglycerol acyltransferase [Myxozyma melibiosi]|uniref:Phospholipid:diacylglycerol acyltransferase n=1 Tax=Myxozyma melibiosi TaxID=54550 RepID=A0ABR1FCB1_9ASCO
MPPRRRRAKKQNRAEETDANGAVAEPVGAVPVQESPSPSDRDSTPPASSSSSSGKKKSGKKHRSGTSSSDPADAPSKDKSSREKKTEKKLSQSRRVTFFLGALIGIALAWYFAANQQLVSLEALGDLNLDSLPKFMEDMRDMLPIGMLKEASDIQKKEQSKAKSESFAVGKAMYEEGYRAMHPVVMVPGVISTGLESWSVKDTKECGCETYFRRRLWGSWSMLRSMLLDKNCWLKHITLDPHTGLDPEGYKIRAADGLDAADFFITGYWIWNKILENLAALAYDPNTMYSAAYDWRLSYMDLERRDGYFSKLKMLVEDNKRRLGQKTVFLGHSMGSQVFFYFLKWAEATGEHYGNGGPNWVNDHIDSFVDIAGTMLGTPKAIVALLSGEMKDTVQLNALAVYGLEKFFSRAERAYMLRTFPGVASMLPKGGDAIWGDLLSAPDDFGHQNISFGNFIQFRDTMSTLSSKNLTVAESIDYLFTQAPGWFQNRVLENYSHGLARTRKELEANNQDHTKWANPLEAALPYAPDMKIYCFYGVGKETERAYVYQEEKDKDLVKLNVTIAGGGGYDPVIMGEGDGTVSLITHAMCHKWREEGSKFNPGGSRVRIVEMLHEPERFDPRGGEKSADHVDILGRAELNEMILRIAAGKGEEIEDRFVSRLRDIAKGIDLGPN